MKDIKLSTISKAAGAAAGVITIASVSAWISTKYLLRMALDREEPVLLKAAEKRISGTEQDNGFIRVMTLYIPKRPISSQIRRNM